jgi:hypothetical protein
LAKSAAVAYGEVDCSSPKAFGAAAIPRVRKAARSLLIFKRRILYPIPRFEASEFPGIRYDEELAHDSGAQAGPDFEKLHPMTADTTLVSAQHGVASEARVIFLWIIEGIMKAAALFTKQGRIHNQGRYSCKIAQLQEIN